MPVQKFKSGQEMNSAPRLPSQAADFVEELLLKAGFTRVEHCEFRQTQSGLAGITDLDNREHESLFVEAVK